MISREEVEHVAELARLKLAEDELARLQQQLGQILAAMQALNELETEHVPPTAQVIPLQNVERDDAVEPSLPHEAVLANAPRVEHGQIRVPPVLEES